MDGAECDRYMSQYFREAWMAAHPQQDRGNEEYHSGGVFRRTHRSANPSPRTRSPSTALQQPVHTQSSTDHAS